MACLCFICASVCVCVVTDWPGESLLYCAESVPVAFAHASPACPAPVTSLGNQLEHMRVSDGEVCACIQLSKDQKKNQITVLSTKGMTYN